MFRPATSWESLFALSAEEGKKLIVIHFSVYSSISNEEIEKCMEEMGKRHPKINSHLILRDKLLYWEPRQGKNYLLIEKNSWTEIEDLAQEPIFLKDPYVKIVKMFPSFVFIFSHALLDGMGMNIFCRDFFSLLEKDTSLCPLPNPYPYTEEEEIKRRYPHEELVKRDSIISSFPQTISLYSFPKYKLLRRIFPLSSLRKRCHQENITIHSLFMAAIVSYFSGTVNIISPIGLRPLLGNVYNRTIDNYFWGSKVILTVQEKNVIKLAHKCKDLCQDLHKKVPFYEVIIQNLIKEEGVLQAYEKALKNQEEVFTFQLSNVGSFFSQTAILEGSWVTEAKPFPAFAIHSQGKRLNLCMNYSRDFFNDEKMKEFLHGICKKIDGFILSSRL